MPGELELATEHLERVNEIVVEYLKGKEPTRIAKEMGLKRAEVTAAIEEWRIYASNNSTIRERARDALAGADVHFTSLIGHAYDVLDESTIQGQSATKLNAIKLIKDIEAQRIELLQKAGLLDNKELAETMVEMEQKYEAMKKILNTVLCDECRGKVLKQLQEMSKEPVVIDVA